MKRHAHRLAIALFALALPWAASAADYAVQPAQSTLGFSGEFQGEAFDGQFGQWSAAISYDDAKLSSSAFDVKVVLASAKTGDSDRDAALPGTAFFDVAQFPQAHFVSTGFRRDGVQVVVDGKLTLRGVTRPISLKTTFTPQPDGSATLDVAGTVERLDFGVGSGEYADTSVIGANVTIHAHLQLAPK